MILQSASTPHPAAPCSARPASGTLSTLLARVPSGISNCYKQKCLKSVDLEVMYASFWSGNWQIMWGLLTFPINWIHMPPPAVEHEPADTGEFLTRAWTCF